MPAVIAVRGAQFDFRDIAQAQPVSGNDEIADLLDRSKLSTRANAQPLVPGGDPPGVDREVASCEQVTKVLYIDSVGGDEISIHENPDLTRIDTVQVDA